MCDSFHKKQKLCDGFFGPTTFHQGRQLFEVVGPDVQKLWMHHFYRCRFSCRPKEL